MVGSAEWRTARRRTRKRIDMSEVERIKATIARVEAKRAAVFV
jgi:hypothetical protein